MKSKINLQKKTYLVFPVFITGEFIDLCEKFVL